MTASETQFHHISRTGSSTRIKDLTEALEACNQSGYIWMDFYQPDKDLLMSLIEPLGLHPLSIEDCLDEHQIPKIDDYPSHSFMIFNAFNYSNQELNIYELDFFIGEHYLISVQRNNGSSQQFFQEIERYFTGGNESLQQRQRFDGVEGVMCNADMGGKEHRYRRMCASIVRWTMRAVR